MIMLLTSSFFKPKDPDSVIIGQCRGLPLYLLRARIDISQDIFISAFALHEGLA